MLGQIVQDRIQRPLQASGLLEGVTDPNGGIGYEGFFSCSFYVNDPVAALPMVQQELQRVVYCHLLTLPNWIRKATASAPFI
jgi:hypothetical protein